MIMCIHLEVVYIWIFSRGRLCKIYLMYIYFVLFIDNLSARQKKLLFDEVSVYLKYYMYL